MSQDLIDTARVATSGLAVICAVFMAIRAYRVRKLRGDEFAVWATGALCVAMAFVVIVQVRQIGQPLATWWGLPMLALIVLLTLGALWRSDV